MPQGPFSSNGAVQTGTTVRKPVTVDASGNLLVTGNVSVLAQDTQYVACTAGNTTKCGGNGTTGDFIDHVIIVPAAVNPGNVSIEDGNVAILIYQATGNLTSTESWSIPVGAKSTVGAWSIINGANISSIAIGKFTP